VWILSTYLNTEEVIPGQPIDTIRLTFSELIQRLEAHGAPPTLEQLNSWLAAVEVTSEDLHPYLGFKEGNYWRHRVCRNDSVEMLVICWRPGQKTPIHDHNGSHGMVKVQQGVMWETTFAFNEDKGLGYKTGRENTPFRNEDPERWLRFERRIIRTDCIGAVPEDEPQQHQAYSKPQKSPA